LLQACILLASNGPSHSVHLAMLIIWLIATMLAPSVLFWKPKHMRRSSFTAKEVFSFVRMSHFDTVSCIKLHATNYVNPPPFLSTTAKRNVELDIVWGSRLLQFKKKVAYFKAKLYKYKVTLVLGYLLCLCVRRCAPVAYVT
jgi:hypothetical protein